MKYSLIIPTVNDATIIKNCLSSFKKHHSKIDCEIIISDDGSDKQTLKELTKISKAFGAKLLKSKDNKGFGHAVNIGLEIAKGDIIILCNNDIIFTKPVLNVIKNSFTGNVGIVGCKLVYPDNTIQHAGMILDTKRNFTHKHKHKHASASSKSEYCMAVTGALFAISRECYDEVGNFNKSYFVACEDSEYCLRAWMFGFSVLYNHNAEAIHIEGYTRGNSDQSKSEKSEFWKHKENETIKKFSNDIQRYDVVGFQKTIDSLNSNKIMKLEIGCGNNPQPGYVHMDVRKLPCVDIVHDFENNPLPFGDNTLDEILTNHVIEHISWRSLPKVLKEWHRTLKKDGRVFLRTPDLEFICRTYLDGKTTPEHPVDEGFVKENLSNEVTPSWWANIKLYAGQDYPSNFHFLCFDFEMIKQTLEHFGFEDVKRISVKPIFSPGELQIEAFKR